MMFKYPIVSASKKKSVLCSKTKKNNTGNKDTNNKKKNTNVDANTTNSNTTTNTNTNHKQTRIVKPTKTTKTTKISKISKHQDDDIPVDPFIDITPDARFDKNFSRMDKYVDNQFYTITRTNKNDSENDCEADTVDSDRNDCKQYNYSIKIHNKSFYNFIELITNQKPYHLSVLFVFLPEIENYEKTLKCLSMYNDYTKMITRPDLFFHLDRHVKNLVFILNYMYSSYVIQKPEFLAYHIGGSYYISRPYQTLGSTDTAEDILKKMYGLTYVSNKHISMTDGTIKISFSVMLPNGYSTSDNTITTTTTFPIKNNYSANNIYSANLTHELDLEIQNILYDFMYDDKYCSYNGIMFDSALPDMMANSIQYIKCVDDSVYTVLTGDIDRYSDNAELCCPNASTTTTTSTAVFIRLQHTTEAMNARDEYKYHIRYSVRIYNFDKNCYHNAEIGNLRIKRPCNIDFETMIFPGLVTKKYDKIGRAHV